MPHVGPLKGDRDAVAAAETPCVCEHIGAQVDAMAADAARSERSQVVRRTARQLEDRANAGHAMPCSQPQQAPALGLDVAEAEGDVVEARCAVELRRVTSFPRHAVMTAPGGRSRRPPRGGAVVLRGGASTV